MPIKTLCSTKGSTENRDRVMLAAANLPKMTASRLAMWRTLIAMTHVNANCSRLESLFLENIIATQNLHPDDFALLQNAFLKPQSVNECYAGMSSPRDRGWFLALTCQLFLRNIAYMSRERELFDHLARYRITALRFTELSTDLARVRQEFADFPDKSRRGTFSRLLRPLVIS